MAHKDAVKIHARIRARQRLGLPLSESRIARMVQAIQEGRTRCIQGCTNNRKVHLFSHNEVYFAAVYSKTMKTIVTVWELDAKGRFDKTLAVEV